MVNGHQQEEVDYAMPQSASTTTGPVERLADVVVTDNNADTAHMLLPGGAPTLATSTDEATTPFPSATTRSPDFHRHSSFVTTRNNETPLAGFGT